MSSKKKIGIVIVVAVLAITFMTVAFLTTQTNTDYYTQIDILLFISIHILRLLIGSPTCLDLPTRTVFLS